MYLNFVLRISACLLQIKMTVKVLGGKIIFLYTLYFYPIQSLNILEERHIFNLEENKQMKEQLPCMLRSVCLVCLDKFSTIIFPFYPV
jgi:hypothetical protein